MKVRFATVIGHFVAAFTAEPCAHMKAFPMDTSSVVLEQQHVCDKCGQEFTGRAFIRRYDTPSGRLEPGDMYWNTWLKENHYWDNHKGPHLEVLCPNGYPWNIDSRASNCGSPNDRNHRCWIRHGEAPNITVDKQGGPTCSAGAGSIIAGDYHGFLVKGEFTPA